MVLLTMGFVALLWQVLPWPYVLGLEAVVLLLGLYALGTYVALDDRGIVLQKGFLFGTRIAWDKATRLAGRRRKSHTALVLAAGWRRIRITNRYADFPRLAGQVVERVGSQCQVGDGVADLAAAAREPVAGRSAKAASWAFSGLCLLTAVAVAFSSFIRTVGDCRFALAK